jgi:hypothetical protein
MVAILDDGSDVSFATTNSISPERVKELAEAYKNSFSPSGTSGKMQWRAWGIASVKYIRDVLTRMK